MNAQAPVGIFDSGIGGLTVAKAVTLLLPHERIVYFGDTAHLPYGDKSAASIQAYSVRIADFLLKKGCKAILIACNSASSVAYELVKAYMENRALVLDVITPTITYVATHYAGTSVGLIGTKQTVHSNAYGKHQLMKEANVQLKALATPLLAPMIEEGFFNNTISRQVIEAYLKDPVLKDIQALILACTHYPLIKNQIADFFNDAVEIIDGSTLVAEALKKTLKASHLLQEKNTAIGTHEFYVSDYTASFEASTKLFFGEKVVLQAENLWL